MKKSVLVFLLFFFGISHAEVFQSHIPKSGRFSLGVEPEIIVEGNTDFSLFLHAGFGLGHGYGAHFKVGFGQSAYNDDPVYIGGMIDFQLLRDGKGYPGIYFSLGANSLGKVSINDHLIVHNNFGQVTLYGGLDDAIRIFNNAGSTDVSFPIELIMGAEIDVTRPFHFLAEGGIDLHRSASFISLGFKYYFL
jgi:hypothetical protein